MSRHLLAGHNLCPLEGGRAQLLTSCPDAAKSYQDDEWMFMKIYEAEAASKCDGSTVEELQSEWVTEDADMTPSSSCHQTE